MTYIGRYAIIAFGNAAIAQSVVRRIGSAEVAGPIPASSFAGTLDLSGVFCFFIIIEMEKINERDILDQLEKDKGLVCKSDGR